MDSSSEADSVVQSVASPSLPDGLLDANLSDWLPQSQWELGVEGFDTPPVSNQRTREESDVLLLLASQHEFADDGDAQARVAVRSTPRRLQSTYVNCENHRSLSVRDLLAGYY